MAKPRKATKRPAGRDHAAIAATFEADVLEGRFPAGRMFRLAIERQRRDMEAPPVGFVFDAEVANRACRLMELIPFGGEGPRRGTPFRLEPWQVWLVRVLFGWVDPVTGWARFRLAHIWLPKGNGKSPLAALIAVCVMIQGGGGEKVYSAASTQKQARHVFDGAREMLSMAPQITERFELEVREHSIIGTADSRAYEPVSKEAGSIEGIRPSLLILDEVHVLATRKLYDNLRSAANKVDGSRFVTISTAGFDMSPQAIGWQLYCRTRDVLEGKADDPSLFAFIVEADRDLDPLDFETWRQANPNLGVSVSIAGLKSAMQTMREVPSERPSLEVKHLGWWQQTGSAFLDVAAWNALGRANLSLEDFTAAEGWTVYAGGDLARTRDLTALVFVAARVRDDGKVEYRVFTREAFLPAESVTLKTTPELREWAKAGWLTLVPGQTMTYRPITARCVEVAKARAGLEVCIDEWSAAEVENDLMQGGATPVPVRQGAKTQSEPMKEIEAAILDGRLEHDGSPLMAWCIGNLIAERDRNGNVAPAKENEHKKIDLAVALVNAVVRARFVGLGNAEGHVGPLIM